MILNDIGKIAEQCWLEIPSHFPNVQLDEFVIMPNHFHAILIIVGNGHDRSLQCATVRNGRDHSLQLGFTNFQWQKSYYEHIVRNDDELNRIRQYIIENPMKWEIDENYINK